MYEFLVVIHILSAIAWVGGGALVILSLRSVRDREGHPSAERTLLRLEKASIYLNPAPVLVIGTGIAMVAMSGAWAFSQAWIYASIGLFVVALVLGAGVADRASKQVQAAQEKGRSEAAALDRLVRVGAVEIALMVGIVFLMVYKPL